MKTMTFAAALLAAFAASAQTPPQNPADHSAHHPAAPSAGEATPLSEGEVRRIDMDQGKITLRHGPLNNLDMPAMTMVFVAQDKRLLEGLKQGDKVRFTAAKINGTFTVTAIQSEK